MKYCHVYGLAHYQACNIAKLSFVIDIKGKFQAGNLPLDNLCKVSNSSGYYQKMLLQHKEITEPQMMDPPCCHVTLPVGTD